MISFKIFFLVFASLVLTRDNTEKKKIDNDTMAPAAEIPFNGRARMEIDGKPILVYSSPGMPNSLRVRVSNAEKFFGMAGKDLRSDDDLASKKFIHFGRPIFDEIRYNGIKLGEIKDGKKFYSIKYNSAFSNLKFGSFGSYWPVFWEERDAYSYPDADAIVGPYGIPAKIVKYNLRAPQAGEQIFSLPLASAWRWWVAGIEQVINGRKIHFAFAPQFETSVAGASAAAHISQIHKGHFTDLRKNVVIAYDVERPTRQVNFTAPITLGAITIPSLLVRTEDFGSASSIPEKAQKETPENKSDIVVTGRRKIPPGVLIVYVGADALAGCSSITYDKPAKQIHLSCTKAPV